LCELGSGNHCALLYLVVSTRARSSGGGAKPDDDYFLVGVLGVWKRYVRICHLLAILLAVLAFFPLETTTITIQIRVFMLFNSLLIFLGYLVGRRQFIRSSLITMLWLIAFLLITLLILPGVNNSVLLPKVPTTVWEC
jgi:hypothetical protein